VITCGPPLFGKKDDGQYLSRIATLFPRYQLLVTAPPMHALQREAFKEWLAARQTAAGEPVPGAAALTWEALESVDLIVGAGDTVLIRPELDRLDLAFTADELLQEAWAVPRHRIRFLSVNKPEVRQALRERGELWRLMAPPLSPEHIAQAIAHSRVAISQQAIYYYNPHTGSRFITCDELQRLDQLDDAALAAHLEEIAQHCTQRNRHGHPEVAFFAADPLKFGAPNFVGIRFTNQGGEELRSSYTGLVRRFLEAVEAGLRVDDLTSRAWRTRMFTALASEESDEQVAGTLEGLSSEFFLRVRWLPGGRFEEGEFIFAPVFAREDGEPRDPELQPLWDPLARGFIANFIREHGNIEYLNLGRIEATPGAAGAGRGRRGVYLAEIKVRSEPAPRVLFLRVQRWGIRERLEETDAEGVPKDFVRAVFETEEYVDYTLDRRLGCLQFGMHLPPRVNMRRVTELYLGSRSEFHGHFFPVIYFERDYLPGIATNKVPDRKLADPRYALALARLLGRAAAPNIVVGRTRNPVVPDMLGDVLFDDGDEIIVEGANGLPRDLVLVDHSGAFADWRTASMLAFAKGYAHPVNRRLDRVPDPKAFAETYLIAFSEECARLQSDYDRRRAAFDRLFKHLPYSEGSFACRWEHVLSRLQATDHEALVQAIRRHITVLG
jgi:hypothetical protein